MFDAFLAFLEERGSHIALYLLLSPSKGRGEGRKKARFKEKRDIGIRLLRLFCLRGCEKKREREKGGRHSFALHSMSALKGKKQGGGGLKKRSVLGFRTWRGKKRKNFYKYTPY